MGLVRKRLAGTAREAGFTLVELLVVLLIMGLLASVAMPAFLNQRSKAGDSKAKGLAHTAQVAMETCSVSNGGAYSTSTCSLAKLRAIDPAIPASGITANPNTPSGGYTIKVTSASQNTYTIKRETSGLIVFKCTVKTSSRGGCPGSGTKEGNWGS